MSGFQQKVCAILKVSRFGAIWLGTRVLLSTALTPLLPQQEGARAVTQAAPSAGAGRRAGEVHGYHRGEQGRMGPSWSRRGSGKGDIPGTTIHHCPQTPALHSAKTHM